MVVINVIELPNFFNIENINCCQHIKILITFTNIKLGSLESHQFYKNKAFYIKELDLYLLTFTNRTKTQYKWIIFKMCFPLIENAYTQQLEHQSEQLELREQQLELKLTQLISHLNNIFININNIQLAMLKK